jgi:hypothetical protein
VNQTPIGVRAGSRPVKLGYRTSTLTPVEPSLSNQHLNPAVTWRYVSRDGGRHWRYSTQFAAIPG